MDNSLTSEDVKTGYIYGLYASDAPLDCRYIGKTIQTLIRRLRKHLSDAKSGKECYRDRWIRSVVERGATIVIREIEIHGLSSLDDLNPFLSSREKTWIAFGRQQGWRLTNLTDGGEGIAGYRMSQESIERMRVAQSNRGPVSEETREKMAEAKRGKPGNHRGMSHTEATKTKISVAKKGQTPTIETRSKLSASMMGHSVTSETAAKISVAKKGKSFSDEHKAALSVAQQKRRQREQELP